MKIRHYSDIIVPTMRVMYQLNWKSKLKFIKWYIEFLSSWMQTAQEDSDQCITNDKSILELTGVQVYLWT